MPIEGYWNTDRNSYPEYPMPEHSDVPFSGKNEVLKRLVAVETKAQFVRYRGFSHCRCCGINLGNREFIQGEWRWPEGFQHYVVVHNVTPSTDFCNQVLLMA